MKSSKNYIFGVHFLLTRYKSVMEKIRFDLSEMWLTIYRMKNNFNILNIWKMLLKREMNEQHFVYIWANYNAMAQSYADLFLEFKFFA